MTMTSRERVLAAINFEEPDRVPIVIGVNNATGIKMKPYQGIKKIAGIRAPDNYLYDWPELGTAACDPRALPDPIRTRSQRYRDRKGDCFRNSPRRFRGKRTSVDGLLPSPTCLE